MELWTPSTKKLLDKWLDELTTKKVAHKYCAEMYIFRHYLLNIPTIILGGVISGMQLAQSQLHDGEPNDIMTIINILIGTIITTLSMLSLNMKYETCSSNHLNAKKIIEEVITDIELEIMKPTIDKEKAEIFIASIVKSKININETSPYIPTFVYEKIGNVSQYQSRCDLKRVHDDCESAISDE